MSLSKSALAMCILFHFLFVGPMDNINDENTGALKGTITDPQGLAVEGAQIEFACVSSRIERQTISDARGFYQLEALPPATDCVLQVSLASGNFSSVTQERIVIRPGITTVESVRLFASLEETVVVSAKQTERRVVDLEEVGQVTKFSSQYRKRKGRRSERPNILGGRAENFKTIVDGVSNQDVVGGTFSDFNTESYERRVANPFRAALRHPLSTFSIDVDTASYSNVRRFLAHGVLPPPGAVRIEEMINYFDYDYPVPEGDHPFSVDVEATGCPWAPDHRLVRVGLKGDEVAARNRPPANLVFLLDVSGSMDNPDKLPLVKRSLRMLVDNLSPADTVAIAVYAGAAGLVLPATSVASKDEILDAMARLNAGGSTAGGEGIRLAYKIARKNYLPEGINRVILATDGDFNVGVSSTSAMTHLIEKEAKSGVFFTVLGFGMGNLKDDKLENLADKGNGHYAYIDSLFEAHKVLVEELGATLVTIAKDVKIQVEFNPALVHSYRLIGYENRLLRSEDFNDDTKDAGEIGAGHTVTALYEIAPTAHAMALPAEDELKYQRPALLSDAALRGEILTVKIRYKDPDGDTRRLLEVPLIDGGGDLASASPDTRFAAAVACLGMVLRDAPDRGTASMDEAERLALAGLGDDVRGHRAGFVEMVRLARDLATAPEESEN